jgi:hypothetical protein
LGGLSPNEGNLLGYINTDFKGSKLAGQQLVRKCASSSAVVTLLCPMCRFSFVVKCSLALRLAAATDLDAGRIEARQNVISSNQSG